MEAGIYGLLGAFIGSIASIGTIWIQSRAKDRRDRSKQITDLSLAEFNLHMQMATSGKGASKVLPISVFAHHNLLLLDALETGKLTPARLIEISLETDKAVEAIEEIDKRRAAAVKR